MFKRILIYFYHTCWYVTAAIILSAAVCVTVARLLLPHIGYYREDIETWLSHQSGYNIQLENIQASWQGWIPSLYLNGITVMNQEGTSIYTTLESATITIDPYSSLVLQNLAQFRVTIVGPDLLVTRKPNGSLSLAKIEDLDDIQPDVKSNFFTNWLFSQKNIAIEKATITYIDRQIFTSDVQLDDVSIKLKQSGNRIQIESLAHFPAQYGSDIRITLDAYGDILTSDWSGNVYITGNKFYPGKILPLLAVDYEDFTFYSAPASIEVWSDWEKGRLTGMSGNIKVNDLVLPESNNVIHTLSSTFLAERIEDKVNLNINIDELVSQHGTWEPAMISISADTGEDRQYDIHADYLKAEDIIPVIHLFNQDNYSDHDLRFSGILRNNYLVYSPDKTSPLEFQSDAEGISLHFANSESYLSATNGLIRGNLNHGNIILNSSNIDLYLPKVFPEQLSFFEINGMISWLSEEDNLVIETGLLETHTAHFNSEAKGKVIFTEEGSPYIDLQIANYNIDIRNINRYLPVTVDEEFREWMNGSVVEGNVPYLQVLLRGDIQDYPFRENEGQFLLTARIQDMVLDYDESWQPVKLTDGDLEIRNNAAQFILHSGKFENTDIVKGSARIDDFTGDKVDLHFNSYMKGSTNDARLIINDSPLSGSGRLSEILSHEILGQLELELSMDIPLNYEKPKTYKADFEVIDASIKFRGIDTSLDNLEGHITLTDTDISTRNLKATYFNQPVTLSIETSSDNNLKLVVNGHSDSDFIISQLLYRFPNIKPVLDSRKDLIRGRCAWTVIIDALSAGGNVSGNAKMLTLKSDLQGLEINAPEPLGKTDVASEFEISTLIFTDDSKDIRIRYNNKITAIFNVNDNGNGTFNRTEIAIGTDTKLLNTGQGLFIHGSTERVSFSDWYDFINSIDLNRKPGARENIQVDIHTDILSYYKYIFENADVRINNLQPELLVKVEGGGIEGQILIPDDLDKRTVKADFSRLYFQDTEDSSGTDVIDPRTFPALELSVDEFKYRAANLGKLSMTTSRNTNGLSIDTLSFTKPGFSIKGNGSWLLEQENTYSDVDFELTAVDFETMLKTFDYDVTPIKEGATTLNFNAGWKGSPLDFTLAGMNGTLRMNIEKGSFLDIEPSAGRLFGLLSLQTLPRRLSLDFSDLFEKGFAFDEIDGTFTIESGNAYTNNLVMTGPSADIDVSGRTGLLEKDYDQIVTVTPQISDSLPIASALFGPIGIGIGAVIFIAGELFESIPKQVDKLLQYQYSIKGSWEDPVVERIQLSASKSDNS